MAANPKGLPEFDTTPIPRFMAMVSEGFFTKSVTSRDTDGTPAPVLIALEDERISSVRGAINTQA